MDLSRHFREDVIRDASVIYAEIVGQAPSLRRPRRPPQNLGQLDEFDLPRLAT